MGNGHASRGPVASLDPEALKTANLLNHGSQEWRFTVARVRVIAMKSPPHQPHIYHITHGANLENIVSDGYLWSDAAMAERGGPSASVGMSKIKLRRLNELHLASHPGTHVGDYVPFYFCPRSVMLYLLHRGDHPELSYKGGQRPILHLHADLREAVAWADAEGRPWAFTDRNAGSRYFRDFNQLSQLSELNWNHIADPDFREPEIKDAKQAELLVYRSLPWRLIRSVGVFDKAVAKRVTQILSTAQHCPDVRVERDWYY